MLPFLEAMIGKPFMWRTELYGDIAVHLTKYSPNGAVAVLSIDGGEDSTPAQRFPELSDGIGYAVSGQLMKRPRRSSKTVENTVRDVPGVGKVAVVTTTKRGRDGTMRRSIKSNWLPM